MSVQKGIIIILLVVIFASIANDTLFSKEKFPMKNKNPLTQNIIVERNVTKIISCKNSWVSGDDINSSNITLNKGNNVINVRIDGYVFNKNILLHIYGIYLMPSILEFDFTRYVDDNFTKAWSTGLYMGTILNASKPFWGMEFDGLHWGFDNRTTMIARHMMTPGDTWHIKMVIYSNYTYDVYVNGTEFLRYNTGLSTIYKPTTSEIIWELPASTINGDVYHYELSNITQTYDRRLIQPLLPYKKYISFTMDDATLNEYDYSQILHEYGFNATIGVITGYVNATGHMNLSQLNELYSYGFEMADHTVTHPHLTRLPLPHAKENISDARDWLFSRRFYVYTFIPPYGATNKTIDEYAWNFGLMDNYNMHRIPFADGTSSIGYISDYRSILSFVQNSSEGYVVLYNHGKIDLSQQNFTKFIKNASKSGYIIGTAKDLWRAQYALMNFNPDNINFTNNNYIFKANIDGYVNIYDYYNLLNITGSVVVKENGIQKYIFFSGQDMKFWVEKGKSYLIEPFEIEELDRNPISILFSGMLVTIIISFISRKIHK